MTAGSMIAVMIGTKGGGAREPTIVELMAAKDYLERGHAILQKADSVIAEDVRDNILALRHIIIDMQLNDEAA